MSQPIFSPKILKRVRLDAGLTQSEAGALIHASLATFQSWEYGKRNMPVSKWELFLLKVKALPAPW